MQTIKIAQAVKDYIVDLAINDNLPMDLTQLDVDTLAKVIESQLPTQNEKAIELASHYLCESDEMSIEDQVKRVYNHEDEDDMIDNVDGVIVWEKVEYSFTCEQFIYEIGFVL